MPACFTRSLTVLILVILGLSGVQAQQQHIIDSLERQAVSAKIDWERLDLAVGLFRQYLFSNQIEKADKQLATIYSLQGTIPSAEAYGLIMENLYAYIHEGNDDKAIEKCLKAIEVSKRIKDNNTLAYARYQLAENYAFEKGDPKRALDVMLTSLKEIDNNVSLKTRGNSFKITGYIYGRLGEFEKGYQHLNQSIVLFQELIDNPPLHLHTGKPSAENVGAEMHLANAYDHISELLQQEGKNLQAIEIRKKGLALMERAHNDDMIAFLNQKLGELYLNAGDLVDGLDHLQKSLVIFEKLGLERDIANCNTQLTNVYIRMEEYGEAEKYLNKNITYFKARNDSVFLAGTLLQGVRLYLGSGNLSKASQLINEADPIAQQLEMVEHKGTIERMRGNLALKNAQYPDAVRYFKKAIAIFKQEDSKPFIARATLEIANAYHELKQYDSALTYVDAAIASAQAQSDLDLARDAHKIKSAILASTGDYQAAYEIHQQFFKLHDSLYADNAQARLKQEQVRQDVVAYQNEKRLAEQNAALLESQNRFYVVMSIVVLVILMLLAYLYFNLRKVKAKLQIQNVQLTQLSQTKDKFFGIIAHDLRSPLLGLQSVGDQIDYFLKKGNTDRLEQVSKNISDTTKRLNELLDNLLNWALLQNGMIPYHPQKVNVKPIVDDIIQLLNPLAELKKIKMINLVPDNVAVYADEKAVNTILRNLISNALKFTRVDGSVVIDIKDNGHQASIIINDTGTGISAEQLPHLFELEKDSKQGTMGEKGTGLGLVLCKELVELNQGGIKVESEIGKGSTFTLNLPKAA